MIIECPACTKTQDDINREFLENKKNKQKKIKKENQNEKCIYCLGEGYITVF